MNHVLQMIMRMSLQYPAAGWQDGFISEIIKTNGDLRQTSMRPANDGEKENTSRARIDPDNVPELTVKVSDKGSPAGRIHR
jgi:hypothetical protein